MQNTPDDINSEDVLNSVASLAARRIVIADDPHFEFHRDGLHIWDHSEILFYHKSVAARRIQKAYRRYRRDRAARIIQRACANWIDKPITADGKLGIACRLIQQWLPKQ